MITLNKLTWSNCFSYGPDNVLDLQESGLTQIVGTNGVGKSSIPLILEEVLYNKNSKGVKKADVPNRYVDAGYAIHLTFTKDSDEYEIDLNRRASLRVKFLKNGEDISSHTATNTYKSIQEVLGIDFKTFSQLVYQNTNSSLQFLTATDTNRKKFLIDLLNLDEYVEYFEVFKSLAKEVNSEVTSLSSQIATIEKWLTDNKLSTTEVQPLLEISIETEEDEKLLGSLSTKIENISKNNKIISRNNHYKDQLSKLDFSEISKIPATEYQSYEKETSQVGALRAEKKAAEAVLEKTKKLGNQCYTCGQEIDEEFKTSIIEEQESKIAKIKEQAKEILERVEEIKKNNELFEKKKKLENEFEKLYSAIDHNLPVDLYNAEELQEEYDALQSRITEARQKLKKLIEENQRRERANTRISVIQEQTESFVEQLEKAQADLEAVETTAMHFELLKKAFSTNGLLAYKIENLVKELEELTNTYLAELSDGRFTLEFAVSNDKLNVNITDNGKEVDISALSSGELARVNTATLIAIRKLMSSISKSQINVLFLDEVINVLDEQGREKLVEVLLKEEFLNTYLVSHGWSHPLLTKVQVVKTDNQSRLEW